MGLSRGIRAPRALVSEPWSLYGARTDYHVTGPPHKDPLFVAFLGLLALYLDPASEKGPHRRIQEQGLAHITLRNKTPSQKRLRFLALFAALLDLAHGKVHWLPMPGLWLYNWKPHLWRQKCTARASSPIIGHNRWLVRILANILTERRVVWTVPRGNLVVGHRLELPRPLA